MPDAGPDAGLEPEPDPGPDDGDEVRLDGEGNPIDDQPLIERTIDQWPLALVLLTVASGLMILTFIDFRVGAIVLGASLVFAGALRTVLTQERAGLLAIRGRPIDLMTMYGLGVALTTVAVVVPPAR